MACRACAEEARASGGVGSRVALDFEKLETAGWTVEQWEKSLVFFSPLPEKKRFQGCCRLLEESWRIRLLYSMLLWNFCDVSKP